MKRIARGDIAAGCALLLLAGVLSLRLWYVLDPDFGWHLYFGRYMAEGHGLIRTMVGYTVFRDLPLIDHQWLSHILFYRVYQVAGYGGLICLTVTGLLGSFGALYWDARLRGVAPSYAVFAITLYALSCQIVFGVRLQILFLFWLPILVLVHRHVTLAWKRGLIYFAIYTLLSNMHSGFMVFAFLPAILELKHICWKRDGGVASLVRYAVAVLPVGIGIICNPYIQDFPAFFADYIGDSSYKQGIDEWRFTLGPPLGILSVLVPLCIGLFTLLVGRVWKRIHWTEGVIVGIAAYLGIQYIRFFPTLMLFLVPHLAVSAQEAFGYSAAFRHTRRLAIGGMVLLAVLAMWGVQRLPAVSRPFEPKNMPYMPHALIEAVDTSGICPTGDWLVHYAWAGYMLGFYPNTSVLIDGRGPQAKVPSGETLLQVYDKLIRSNGEQADRLLRQYTIGCVLLPDVTPKPIAPFDRWIFGISQTTYTPGATNLYTYLEKNEEWEVKKQDDLGAVFVRKSPLTD